MTWKFSLFVSLQHSKVLERSTQSWMSNPRSCETLRFSCLHKIVDYSSKTWIHHSETWVCCKGRIKLHSHALVHSNLICWYNSCHVWKIPTFQKSSKNYSTIRIDKKKQTPSLNWARKIILEWIMLVQVIFELLRSVIRN